MVRDGICGNQLKGKKGSGRYYHIAIEIFKDSSSLFLIKIGDL